MQKRRTISLMLSLLLGTCAAVVIASQGGFASNQEQEPFERVIWEEEILTENGTSKIWICNDPDCGEGCTTTDPAWGIGLILEESRKLQRD